MTLRVALVIDGDGTGAKKAAEEASRGLKGLQTSVRDVANGLAMMPGPIGNIAGRLSAAMGLMERFGVAGGVAAASIGAISLVATKAVDAYRQLEKEQATYNGVIRATGMAAGRTGEDIEGLATSIRKASTATEGEVRSAAAILLTFRSVAGDAFDETLKLSQDLAAVGFGSIISAATMMGKALEDPERGLLALRRVGVSFSETQQQLIKNFIETGQRGKAQQSILEGVRQQVGGAGASQANTLVGATNQLGEATNNLLERWGQQIAKGIQLQGMMQGLAGAIDAANKAAEHAASPEGRLAAARAELEDLQRRRAAGASQIAPTASERALGGAPSRLGIAAGEVSERLLKEKVAAAEAAVEFDNFAKTHERLIASMSAWVAAEDAIRQRFEGVVGKIKEDTDELRKNALQREINKELKRAEIDQSTAEGQARAKAIGDLVRERFELANGTQMIQARVAALGSAATEAEKLAAKEAELGQALREGTINRDDYNRALRGAQLDSLISAESRRLGMLEDLARVDDVVANKQREINQLRSQGIGISEAEERAILSRTRILTDAQRLESQLAFERAQLGRSEIEQRIAQELRSKGIDPGSREGRDRAGEIRELEQLKISKDLLDDLVGGGLRELRNELKQGANAWDAMGKVGLNALDRLSDKLMDMVMKDLLAKAFGGVNLFSLLGGGGDLGAISGGKGFDVGGYTGDGGRHEVAGVVHRREFVMNADATARHYPLLRALNDNRLPGYASGGMVGPPPSGFGNSGGAPISIQPQIVSNVHNYSGLPGVTQSVSEKGSVITIDTIIPQLEAALADRQARGRGALSRVAGQSRYRG